MGGQAAARRQAERPLAPAAEWTEDFVQAVRAFMPQFLQCDIAPSTASTYNQGVKRYQAFCTAGKLPLVLTPTQIRDFVACLVWANYKLSTIMVTFAGLRRWAVDSGDAAGLDAFDHPEVKRALKVASKLAVSDVRQKLPLAFDDLQRVLQSKTDPGAGAWVLLSSGYGSAVSPAKVLRKLQLLVGGSAAQGPVFKTSLAAVSPLQKGTVACRLKRALERAGECEYLFATEQRNNVVKQDCRADIRKVARW
eukprot:gene13393-13520_t